ncbi:MAG: hypothetical protein V1694_10190 [Candidatus Eisenbacteria bacterium]
MAKEKIVRCKVRRPDAGNLQESVRFVPLEVFHLWKHLMTGKHNFTVAEESVSIWFDIDGDPNVSYSDANYEKVLRFSMLIYSEKDGMYHKITRYFPSGGYAEIKPRILSHYAQYFDSPQFPPRIEETCGVWLKRDD